MTTCIDAVESAFRHRAEGRFSPSGVMALHVRDGTLHAKGASLDLERSYCAVKVNANFPGNPRLHGLPTILGVLALFDAANGTLLALMDSMSITTLRTAAATAVAARYLALKDASSLALIGCGVQARAHLSAIRAVRTIDSVYVYDIDKLRARAFAAEMTLEHGIPVRAAATLDAATQKSAMIVTCTPAQVAFLGTQNVAPGSFIGAVGADNEDKHEIKSSLMRASVVVTDDLEQCASIGDLHHAIVAGTMTRRNVAAQLGDVILNPACGRKRDRDIAIFDSTGVAIEDVAAAVVVFERAEAERTGTCVAMGT